LNPKSTEASYNLGNPYHERIKGYNAVENYTAAWNHGTQKKRSIRRFIIRATRFMITRPQLYSSAKKALLRNDPMMMRHATTQH
jgi:hypothetical protein